MLYRLIHIVRFHINPRDDTVFRTLMFSCLYIYLFISENKLLPLSPPGLLLEFITSNSGCESSKLGFSHMSAAPSSPIPNKATAALGRSILLTLTVLFFFFILTVREQAREALNKACQGSYVYRPGLELCSNRKHSWHPVQDERSRSIGSLLLLLSNIKTWACSPLSPSPVVMARLSSVLPPPRPSLVYWDCFTFPVVSAALWFWLLSSQMISYMVADAHKPHEFEMFCPFLSSSPLLWSYKPPHS